MKSLNIIIVGAGKVGTTLCEALSKEGNNITLIDINETRLRDAASQFDVMTYVGNGASFNVLEDCGIQYADLFIAVTTSDELNLLCCTVASTASGCNTIARVRTPVYSSEVSYLREKLGLTMAINPELESASEITRILNLPAALEVYHLARGEAQMIQFKVHPGSRLIDRNVTDVAKMLPRRALFSAVERGGETFIPNGSYVFHEADKVCVITARRDRTEILKTLGILKNPVKNCMIIGGGTTAYYLARYLIAAGIHVKIIEKDMKRCEELSAQLPKADIVNGDGADTEVLREEGISLYEAVVPYTGIDEINVMLTLYAKKTTEAKAVTKVSRYKFSEVIEDLDLGSVIFPRRICTDMILSYTRAKSNAGNGDINSLYRLLDDRVEAIEFAISSDSPVTGKPLSEMRLRDNVLIAFIFRNGKVIFPGGNDIIKAGDSVMIVTTNFGFNDIQDILA